MFVILTYDVNAKRDGKVMKACRRYLTHEQKSVFEGVITQAKLRKLKDELKKLIAEHPDYPIVVVVWNEVVGEDIGWWYAPEMRFDIGEILDCEQDIDDERTYTNRDDFEEDVESEEAMDPDMIEEKSDDKVVSAPQENITDIVKKYMDRKVSDP